MSRLREESSFVEGEGLLGKEESSDLLSEFVGSGGLRFCTTNACLRSLPPS